jgi:hypothetical protein
MPFTLNFSHCYLILNGYFPLFLHLVTSLRFNALLEVALLLLLFKSFCPLFAFEHFSKRKHMFGIPPLSPPPILHNFQIPAPVKIIPHFSSRVQPLL